MGIDRSQCYGPDDFRIGSFVNVFGRNLYLHDCDEFSRGWYKVLAQLQQLQALNTLCLVHAHVCLAICYLTPWSAQQLV